MGLWDSDEQEFSGNRYLESLEDGLNLITRLLAVNSHETEAEKKLELLANLIEQDYMELARRDNLPNEAEVYDRIKKAQQTLEEMVKFAFLTDKNIVAVGGGFSAGKSQFINSLLGEELLPTDITPTTSIPTYITSGEQNQLIAFNIFGKKSEIDVDALQAICHAFAQKYNMSFTQILKYITVQNENMPFHNIAFLDTPGYTKSDVHKKEDNTDENIARQHLQAADYLLWVIDIEKGTIPAQDIEFIRTLNFQKPIFFIFNKADKKQPSDAQKILEVAQKDIQYSGLNMAGIAAYSSFEQQFEHIQALMAFLDRINRERKRYDIINEFHAIFTIYVNHHQEVFHEEKSQLNLLNTLDVFFRDAHDNKVDKLKEAFTQLKRLVETIGNNIETEEKLIDEFQRLSQKFEQIVKDILQQIEMDNHHQFRKGA